MCSHPTPSHCHVSCLVITQMSSHVVPCFQVVGEKPDDKELGPGGELLAGVAKVVGVSQKAIKPESEPVMCRAGVSISMCRADQRQVHPSTMWHMRQD